MHPFQMAIPNNLAKEFFETAEKYPNKTALIEVSRVSANLKLKEEVWNYRDFAKLVQQYQRLLDSENLKAGHRALFLLPPSVKMYALVAACFANGIVAVFIDSSIGRKRFLKALRLARPQAVFSVKKFLKLRFFLPSLWFSKLFSFDSNGFGVRLWQAKELDAKIRELNSVEPTGHSLISFTSGSAGRLKAVDRRHDILFFQRQISKSLWAAGPDDVELTAFPIVVFSNLAHGVTTLLPPDLELGLDKIDVETWSSLIQKFKVNRLLVPPAILKQFIDYFDAPNENNQAKMVKEAMSQIKKLITGGAPVPNWIASQTKSMFKHAQCFVVYGSTEAEPISFASFDEVLRKQGQGYFVGYAISDIRIRIVADKIKITEALNQLIEPKQEKGIGEIWVQGPHVVEAYFQNSQESNYSKFRDHSGRVWHRTGDLGYWDDEGGLWISGRLNDRLFESNHKIDPYCLEHPIENLLKKRVAISKTKTFGIELYIESPNLNQSEQIEVAKFFKGIDLPIRSSLVDKLPLDKRHYWKIERQSLKKLKTRNLDCI